uniref:ORF21 n=1 Tax=Nitrosopumilaceae spindle-shaped virus TaxID=3065433 RepID=A0AAT9JAH1_9VIRU
MKIKLRNSTEIEMWFDGKKRNMQEKDIITSILVLRALVEIEDDTKTKVRIVKI